MNEAPLRVALLHNYRERQQMSMKLYAEKLGEALEQRGVQVQRVLPRTVLPERSLRRPVLSKADSYLGRFALYPAMTLGLQADVFHVIDHGQAHLLLTLDPARTVVTCHDVILLVLASGRLGTKFSPPLATHVLRFSLKAMRRTRWIIADSEATRDDLATFVGVDPAHVTVIAPGLNYNFRPIPGARAEVRAQHQLGEGPLLLQVGQVGFYKNLDGVLRTLARLRAGGIPATLVRSGQKLRPEQLHLAERLGVLGAVRDLGPSGPEELARLYNAVDLLLFPSLYEGFGWPPLEAMASGTPVVCSRAGSLAEVVGDAALTAEPEDVEGLAEHAASVLTRPELAARLRERGLARAARYDWGRTAEQVQAVYQRVRGG